MTGLFNLTNLDLSYNLIGRLNFEVFTDLKRLKTLDLSSNPLHLIEEGVLDGLVSLDSLSISKPLIVYTDSVLNLNSKV